MKLKALLLCEDVRFEIGGGVSLIGVLGERMIVSAGEGDIVLSKLSFIVVIGGLRGVEQLAFRQWIRISQDDEPESALRPERHDPQTDEHNFVFAQSPMVFPAAGTYEVGIDLEVDGRRVSYRYPFTVVRRAP